MKAGISLLSFAVQTVKKSFSFNLNLQVASEATEPEATESGEETKETEDVTSTPLGFRKN